MLSLRKILESLLEEGSPESVPVFFRGEKFFVSKENLLDNTMSKVFLFVDAELNKVYRGSKGVMLVKKSDLEDKLK